jgi:hypothetical protein
LIVTLLLAPLAGIAAPFQDAPKAAESLLRAAPEGALVTLVCEDVPSLVAGLRASPLGALWDDDALAPLRASLDEIAAELWEEELFPGGPQGGELILGLEAVAVYMGAFEDDEPTVGALVLAVRDELSHELAAMLAAQASSSERVVVDGLEYQIEQDEDGGWIASGEWLRGLVFGFGDERADALAWAGALVEGLEAEPGRSTPLGAELAPLSSPFPALQVHVDVGAFVRAAVESEDDDADSSLAEVEQFGLTRLGWGSLSMGTPPGGAIELRVSLEVPRDTPLGSLCSVFRPAPIELGRMAPRETIDATFVALDVQALWRSIEELVATFAPELAEGSEQTPPDLLEQRLQEIDALLGVDLRSSLIDNLTGEFAGFVLPGSLAGSSSAASLGLLPMDGVGVVGLRDRDAMEDLIDAAIGLSGADARITEEELEGQWVQMLDLSELGLGELRPCWTVLEDALLMAYNPQPLRALLVQRTEDAPPSWLDDEPRTRRARELVAQGACSLSIADAPDLFRARVLEPARAAALALDGEASGGLAQMFALGLAQAFAGDEDEEDAAHARELLHQAIGACERLLEGGITGHYLSSMTWSDGTLGARLWTEPEKRD